MKFNLIILMSKICLKLLKLLGRGSSLPGEIALKFDKELMKKFKITGKIIAVTGSSGKGSTSSMLVNTLRGLGYTVAHNMKGSNLKFGIATLLIENCNLKGELTQDYVVFEMDERYAKYVFCDIEPDFVIVTNVTRDQPPRQGNVDVVLNDIKKAIPEKSQIILNADSPYMYKLIQGLDNKVSYYSVNKNKYSTQESIYKKLNIYTCPECGTKLTYEYYNFEENGKYRCKECDFYTPKAICTVTNIDYTNNNLLINNEYPINSETKLLFNVYNIAACFCALMLLDVDLKKSSDILSSDKLNKKIYSCISKKDKKVYILNNKNENATTFNQSLHFVNQFEGKKTIVVGWYQISRRYEFNDISWLYDIDFEILNSHDIDSIICVGPERYDIATRFKLANIDSKKIYTFEDVKSAVNYLPNTKGDIFAILNFDYVKPFTKLIKEDKND